MTGQRSIHYGAGWDSVLCPAVRLSPHAIAVRIACHQTGNAVTGYSEDSLVEKALDETPACLLTQNTQPTQAYAAKP